MVSERNGAWGQAIEVPGLGALNAGRDAEVSVGVVRLAGQLRGRRVIPGPASDHAGVRGQREERRLGPGDRGARPAALNTGGNAAVSSVSCARRATARPAGATRMARPSRCSWSARRTASGAQAIEVPGLAALSTGRSAPVSSVSCASPGNCAAGGYYADRSQTPQGFVTQAR